MFYIKIRIKNKLKNNSEKTEDLIETFAIKNNDKLIYNYNNTVYKLFFSNGKITLIRENENFIHKFIFKLDNITKSEYYIKELNTSIDISIKTTKLIVNNEHIEIDYEIIDGNKYSYILDME